ncbi:MAG TPA: aldo/keto reductase [Aliidongia sp.]|nr:aldo/keto reductase [Aliidongia sp.]
MLYRSIPGTRLRASEIGFGCGGNAGLMVRSTSAEQARVVARALELGINYFDTAPDYGDGAAEIALGRALRAAGAVHGAAGGPIITTKVEVRRQDLNDIAGHVVRSAEQSLRRLGLQQLDVLQIHNGPVSAPPAMENGDYHTLWLEHFLGPRGAMEGLRRLLDRGLVAHVGFVCRGDDGAEVRRLLETGLFRLINVAYNLLNQSAGGAVPAPGEQDRADVLGAAQRRNAGAAVFSPLAGGFLAGDAVQHALARTRDLASGAGRRKHEQASRFEAFARACGGSIAQAAYRFVLGHRGTTTALGGFSSLEQMEEIVAVTRMPPLEPEVLALAMAPPRQDAEVSP